MGIRDQEINNLQRYAEGLGLKVIWKKYARESSGGNAAQWDTDGSCITIFTWPGLSKTDIILNMIHELAHHMAWIYNDRKSDPKLDSALYAEWERKRGDPPIKKSSRKLILDSEVDDSKYQEVVAHEVGIKIPLYKIKISVDLSNWQYSYYYRTGDFPSKKSCTKKEKELTRRYKNES